MRLNREGLKSMLRQLAPALVLISVACSAKGQTEVSNVAKEPGQRISKLQVEAKVICSDAPDRIDVEKLADVTHPRALKASGGREQFTRAMQKAFEFSRAQFQSLTCRLGEPKLHEVRNVLIGVLPQTLEGVTVTKNSIVTYGSVVGISEDDGKTWTFINGKGFPKQFPEFVDVVVIPKEKTVINGFEQ